MYYRLAKQRCYLIIGQVDSLHAACNQDINKGVCIPASAGSLCFTDYPIAANIAEKWMRVNIDIDQEGNLYVPDVYNNRVLIYKDPLSQTKNDGWGDNLADFVIGQSDFQGHLSNQGKNRIDGTTLSLDYS